MPRPTWQDVGHIGSFVGGVGALAATVVGVWAIGFAKIQIEEARRIDARAAYREFMLLALDHPEFSLPNYAALQADETRFEQYEWFVAVMLSSYEQVLETDRVDNAWKATIRSGLEPHKAYLCSASFTKEISDYDPVLQKEIQAVITAKPGCGAIDA
jgi:hypothetical protein